MMHQLTQIQTRSWIFVLSFLPVLFLLTGSVQAASLDEASSNAIAKEIQAMVKTRESKIPEFVVREATPERIDLFYNSLQLSQQPTIIRENGLIFAGRGKLLNFNKPSDVLGKMEAWFPDEFAAARAMKEPRFFGKISLFGPYQDWDAEPAAFIALWKCTPQSAWVRPAANPFMRRRGQDLLFMPGAANSSAVREYDFAHCIQQRIGFQAAFTDAEVARKQQDRKKVADKVVPVLVQKFTQLLAASRCNGTGPDDCVLVMRQWASLAPADAVLAKTMQTLEAELALDAPAVTSQASSPTQKAGKRGEDGLPQFDDVLRRAAYLRAKLQSVLAAPSAWPVNALTTTLQQMTALRIAAIPAMAHNSQLYEIGYRNEAINPWAVVAERIDRSPQLWDAVLAELQRMGKPVGDDCSLISQWLTHAGAGMSSEYALLHLADKPASSCVAPNWEWLRQDKVPAAQSEKAEKSESALELRGRFIDYLNHTESAALRELILEKLTSNGTVCFSQPAPAVWLRELCEKWISEPQTVTLKLAHSKLVLDKAQQFNKKSSVPPLADTGGAVKQAAQAQSGWLAKLLDGMSGAALSDMQILAADLENRQVKVQEAAVWRHPRHANRMLELSLNDEQATHLFFIAGPDGMKAFSVPVRFRGGQGQNNLAQVSDLDGDGNLEQWWAEAFDFCAGDASDRKRRADCSATSADMGEVSGDSLTYFVRSPKAAAVKTIVQPAVKKAAVDDAAHVAYIAEARLEPQTCNVALLADTLEDKLHINFAFSRNAENGDLIALVCKSHPLHEDRTVVALFHDLRNKKGEVREDAKGFVMAVINTNKQQLLQMYREEVELDAITRIYDGSLRLDTARYNLAPGLRALGVRMNIGHSPKCADGGIDDFLMLMIEEGKKLRPVLKNMAMAGWRLIDGPPCSYGDKLVVTDNVERDIVVLPGTTNGWHDLQVVARHTITTDNGPEGENAKPVLKTEIETILRAKNKQYLD
ncbi:hypothetical protein [Undibacterium sp. TC9W]|uniref:hypothetical protein n=1 Tax=Undibacterium sp. TC9W TaxID=3413053 RepID=UPI003BF38506